MWSPTESTHRVIKYFSCSFLSIPIKRENQREINEGALQEEDHCAYRSALILPLWPIQVRFRLLFTTWLSVWVWDIVYDWLLESILWFILCLCTWMCVYVRKSVIMCMKMSELIIGSYSAFMLTCDIRATHTWFMFVFG